MTKEQALVRIFYSLKPWLTKRQVLAELEIGERRALEEAFDWINIAIDDCGLRGKCSRPSGWPRNTGEIALDLVRRIYGTLVNHQQDEKGRWIKWLLDDIHESDLGVDSRICCGTALGFGFDACPRCGKGTASTLLRYLKTNCREQYEKHEANGDAALAFLGMEMEIDDFFKGKGE